MKLTQLFAALQGTEISADITDVEIKGTLDSRQVHPGDLFVAITGLHVDGHLFIPDALRRGAAAIVGQRPLDELLSIFSPSPFLSCPYAVVPDSRLALARLSAAFHGYPGRHLRVIGVTGTDGKTTTVQSDLRKGPTPHGHGEYRRSGDWG